MKTLLRKGTLVIGILMIAFIAGEVWAEPPYGRGPLPSGISAPSKAIPPYVYKTKEEIAWDLMIYGFQNIPPLRARIKDYDDLLVAYRRALRTVQGQDQ